MPTYQTIISRISQSYTGRSLKYCLRALGLPVPADATGMYLNGESPEYICAASLAIAQRGE